MIGDVDIAVTTTQRSNAAVGNGAVGRALWQDDFWFHPKFVVSTPPNALTMPMFRVLTFH